VHAAIAKMATDNMINDPVIEDDDDADDDA